MFSLPEELELLSCKIIKWEKTKAPITKPKMKWREKNLFKVDSLTLKPPHKNSVIWEPIKGTIEKKLVITVAAQKDIWPHGRT